MSPRLEVHVHPRARRAAVVGRRADGALRLDVTAAPEGGEANRAVAELLAEVLGIGRSRVTVVRGRASRTKVVDVEGLGEAEIESRIDAALSGRRDGE